MAVESQIGKQIREVLAASLRRDPESIKPEHHLRDDLGLDSLMTFELLYDLEKAFDLEIPNDDLPGLQTLDDVVKYVERRVGASAGTSTSPSTSPTRGASETGKPKKTVSSTKKAKPTPSTTTKKTAKPSKARKSSPSPKAPKTTSSPTPRRSKVSSKKTGPGTKSKTKQR